MTDHANEIIEFLENQKDLNKSIEKYQQLLKLNNMIQKKFQKRLKTISKKTNEKIKKTLKKNAKKINKIAKDTNIYLKRFIIIQHYFPMQYGLFSGGKKIRSKILVDIGYYFQLIIKL